MTVARAGACPAIIFSALASEFDAVIKRLPSAGRQKTHRDLPPHFVTHLDCESGRKRLVVAVQTGVGSVNAAIVATRIFDYFDKPELAILVGITAGLKDPDRALGDVLVPTATVDVKSGKVTAEGKEPAGLTIPTSFNHQRAFASWRGLEEWALKWKRESPEGTTTTIHSDCTIACTASVIGYGEYAKSYLSQNRKIAGIEMEAIGVGSAASIIQCPLLIVKGISDWADEEKSDLWHQYCMKISADFSRVNARRRNAVTRRNARRHVSLRCDPINSTRDELVSGTLTGSVVSSHGPSARLGCRATSSHCGRRDMDDRHSRFESALIQLGSA